MGSLPALPVLTETVRFPAADHGGFGTEPPTDARRSRRPGALRPPSRTAEGFRHGNCVQAKCFRSRIMALRETRSFRATAMMATFFDPDRAAMAS